MAQSFPGFMGSSGSHRSARRSMQTAVVVAALLLVVWSVTSWFIARHSYVRRIQSLSREHAKDSTEAVHDIMRAIRVDLDVLRGAAGIVAGLTSVHETVSTFSAAPRAAGYAERKRRWSADPRLARTSRALGTVRAQLNASRVSLLDAHGDCIASSDAGTPASRVGMDFSLAPRFLDARKKGGGTEYAADRTSQAPALHFSAPIIVGGRFRGVAVVTMDLPALSFLFGATEAYLSDRYGVIVAASSNSLQMSALPGSTVDGLPAAARQALYGSHDIQVLRVTPAQDGDIPAATRFDDEPVPYMVAFAPLDPYGLTVHVRERLAAMQELQDDRRWHALLVASVGALLILCATFVTLYVQFLRREERALAESEARFRSLIEQPLTGIYVTQEDRIVYANPQMCDIVGWPAGEIIGHDSVEFFSGDPDGMQVVRESRARLAAGTRSVSPVVPFRRKDGKTIRIGIHAVQGLWDGRPAAFVMAADITERQRQEEKLAEYVQQLEQAMAGTLQAVSNMVEQRDPYTAGHERRVGRIAADIAAEMGWPADKCRDLELIGLVHDIGKISVPTEILCKPGRLTALEYDLVKVHAENGYQILKDVKFRLPIADIIHQHHERMDGSGYPQGLKGEQILPEARILAVADVVESMASHRPYRPAVGLDAALREIEGHRGLTYDAIVVDALLRLIREKGYTLPA